MAKQAIHLTIRRKDTNEIETEVTVTGYSNRQGAMNFNARFCFEAICRAYYESFNESHLSYLIDLIELGWIDDFGTDRRHFSLGEKFIVCIEH